MSALYKFLRYLKVTSWHCDSIPIKLGKTTEPTAQINPFEIFNINFLPTLDGCNSQYIGAILWSHEKFHWVKTFVLKMHRWLMILK